MNILVTGAGGKIGSELCKLLEKHKYNVIKFLHGTNILDDADGGRRNVYSGDLVYNSHVIEVFDNYDIDVVVHLVTSRNPMVNPRIRSFDTLEKDIKILFNLVNCSKKNNINKFIFASSLAVNGYLFKEDMIEKIDVVDKIKEVIETTKYNNKTINLSHKKYKETNVNPFLHLNLDSELAAENRMFIGVTKYLSELIIRAFSHESKIDYTNLRIVNVKR
jgi:nucleoside-diphosphate-sugar epimerase